MTSDNAADKDGWGPAADQVSECGCGKVDLDDCHFSPSADGNKMLIFATPNKHCTNLQVIHSKELAGFRDANGQFKVSALEHIFDANAAKQFELVKSLAEGLVDSDGRVVRDHEDSP